MVPERFEAVAMAAAIAGMQVVRRFQIGERTLDMVEDKNEDDTIVTLCDRNSQQAVFDRIGKLMPGAVLIGEEKTNYASSLNIQPDKGQDGWLVDPLDGTSALAQGLVTSTVVVAYRGNHEVHGCVIGEPISGRLWSAVIGKPAMYNYCCPVTGVIDASLTREIHPWQGELGVRKSTVYVDVSHGWAASRTTERHNAMLYGALNAVTNVIMPGSNALMQALVADGNKGFRLAGSITTAKGGPWDLCGVLLVVSSGGYACGYTRTEAVWQECNALDVDTTQALICANSRETLGALKRIFVENMSERS